MFEKVDSNIDLILNALFIFTAFPLLFFSNKLAKPLILEISSGTSIMELMFNSNDSISFSLNLVLPLILLVGGMAILLFTLWKMAKNILFGTDIPINKALSVILSLILLTVIIKALFNAWSLFLLVLIIAFISLFILAILGSLLNSSSATHR